MMINLILLGIKMYILAVNGDPGFEKSKFHKKKVF